MTKDGLAHALIRKDHHQPEASSWAEQLEWHSVKNIPDLAFDHNGILEASLDRLRKRVRRQPLGFNLLPDKFSLLELQALYESVLGEVYDKSNFRKKFLDMKLLEDLGERQTNVKHRPAKLFRFNEERYKELMDRGFIFNI